MQLYNVDMHFASSDKSKWIAKD